MYWGAFTTYLLAAQKSMFLLHGCQQCLLTRVLRLAIIICFTNHRSAMSVWNSRNGGKHHSLLSPGTGDFTHFHLHKKWMPRSIPNGGLRGLQMTGAKDCKERITLLKDRVRCYRNKHRKATVFWPRRKEIRGNWFCCGELHRGIRNWSQSDRAIWFILLARGTSDILRLE